MDDTRDKVIALEVKVQQFREDIRRLADAAEHLNSLLDQAKGAKLLLGLLLLIGAGKVRGTRLPTEDRGPVCGDLGVVTDQPQRLAKGLGNRHLRLLSTSAGRNFFPRASFA